MKIFHSFRLDTANHCLWRGDDRVAIAPKAYDVLRYLVENPERLVSQEELLERLWPETYVNPEVIRKYILEIRKVLGDRLDKPEFIETLPKRGYRFVATVRDEEVVEQSDGATALPVNVNVTNESDENAADDPVVRSVAARSEKRGSSNGNRLRLWKLAMPVLAIAALTLVAAYLRSARALSDPVSSNGTSIVVLPFLDMSPAKDQEYFSDGLSEQLIHDLARIPGLKVVGRSSAFQFKGRNEDLRSVGRKLGVANVLEGSVRRNGNRLRITAELVKADNGFQLWSQTYDREVNDIFAVQDDIARATTEAMQLKLLTGNGQPVASTVHSANQEAYQAYLQANYFLARGHSKEDLDKALAYADQAIKLDDRYAPAWALRATVKTRMAGFSLADIIEGSRNARLDAERAIVLDPNSASGYLALARTQNDYDWDWEAANASLAKAAALEPGGAEVIHHRSYLSRELGNLDEAIKLYEQAVALDPLRTDFHSGLGYLLYAAGRYEQAQAELQRALDLNPKAALVHFTLSKILIAKGNQLQALAQIEQEPNDWAKLTGQVLVYHALGREQDSNAAITSLISKYHADSAFQIAQAYAFRGQTDKSFEWLERAYAQRDGGLTDVKIDPLLKNLRNDPRYTAFLKKMRLPT